MLQYITNTQCPRPIPEQVKAVLEGGCRWIQLRMKEATQEEVAEMARIIKPLTDEKEAFLIINDYVDDAAMSIAQVCISAKATCPLRRRVLSSARWP